MTFVYLMKNQKPLNEEVVKSHVEHLKELKSQGRLVLCGPFSDYPGGMVVFLAEDLAEATKIAEADPFIASGCKTFEMIVCLSLESDNHMFP